MSYRVVVTYQCFRGTCCLHLQAEDGDSMDLCNTAMLLQHYMVSQPLRP